MIFVRDKGRLCNNILQYAHVYAWGREHGRQTMSMRFAYKYRYFHICHTPHHHLATYLFAKYGAKWGLLPVVRFNEPEGDTLAQERQLLSHRHIVAEGWYARWYDLFLKYKDEIIELFQFDTAIEQYATRQFRAEGSPEALKLGVHIRRGDYRSWQGGRFFYTDEQYVGVIRQFLQLHADRPVTVYICGNDPDLQCDEFRRQLSPAPVIFPQGNPGQDLCLLSHCDYLIGAPSTFTLVAAMYHDVPLYWVKDSSAQLSEASFSRFDMLFRQIL